MHRNTIRWVVLFAAVSIIGIIFIQIYWVRQAYNLGQKQFAHRVDLALNDVADKITAFNNDSTLLINPVRQVTPNHFTIELNEPVSLSIAEAWLSSSLEENKVNTDYEYAVYDCVVDTLLLGRYVRFDTSYVPRPNRYAGVPPLESEQSYLAVYFPEQESLLFNRMGFWIFSSSILAIVVLFFAITTFVILRQRRLSEITKEFINNMTHEFKTPISTIGVSSEVLLRDERIEQDDRLKRYAELIAKENARLKKQVEKVLQVATLEKEDFRLNKEEVDLHSIIEQAVDAVQVSLEKKKGRLQVQLNASRHQLLADRVHLTNILYNLLDNAIKYSGDKPPVIQVSTEDAGWGIRLTVKDNGIGMEKEDLRHIFRKFYRVSTGNRHDVKGFGLGLSYVKLMVDEHKGRIQVNSHPGKGSEFMVTLPYKA